MTAPVTTRAETARWWIVTFGVTILLSAFLLFQVQPVVSKAILPWFGGAPAVWTTCMLFFQTLLFCGYLYAHLLQRWLAPRHQVAVHLALVAVALAMLPVIPGADWKPGAAVNPTSQILLLLSGDGGASLFRPLGDQPIGSGVVQRRMSRAVALPPLCVVQRRIAGCAVELSLLLRADVRSVDPVGDVVGGVRSLRGLLRGIARLRVAIANEWQSVGRLRTVARR